MVPQSCKTKMQKVVFQWHCPIAFKAFQWTCKRAFLMALQKCFQVEEESWKETEWQPKKKYERMSGSQKERNRLAAIERVQGKASGYERQVQKLSAIGEARFKRMQVRKGRRDQALLMLLCVL